MRGGGGIRAALDWPSALLLKDAPLNVDARSSVGEGVDVDPLAAANVSQLNDLWDALRLLVPTEVGKQTWSANRKMSMSTPQSEHLMVGRELMLSVAIAAFPYVVDQTLFGGISSAMGWGGWVFQRPALSGRAVFEYGYHWMGEDACKVESGNTRPGQSLRVQEPSDVNGVVS